MPHTSDPNGQYNREEKFFGFHPLHLIDRLFESAERHSILCCHEFCDRLLRMRQNKLVSSSSTSSSSSSSSSSALTFKKEVLEELYQQIEKSLKMNFDKFELYTLNYIFQLTAADERSLWRKQREEKQAKTTSISEAGSLLPLPVVELHTLHNSEKDDLKLLQEIDEEALDADLTALRAQIRATKKGVHSLRLIQPKVASFLQTISSLSPDNMERWHLSDTQLALADLQSSISRLLTLEDQTKKALRGSQFDQDLSPSSPSPSSPSSLQQPLPELSILQLSNQSLLAATPFTSKTPLPSLSTRKSILSKSSLLSPSSSSTTTTTISLPLSPSPPSSQPLFIPNSLQQSEETQTTNLPQPSSPQPKSPANQLERTLLASSKKSGTGLSRSPLASPQPTPHHSLLKLVASELPSGSFCELTGSPLPVFSPSPQHRDSPQLFSRLNLEDGPPGFAMLYERFRADSQVASLVDLRHLLQVLV